jgi:dTMP kinase
MPNSLPTPAAPAQDATRSVLAIPAFRKLWNSMVFSSLGDWLGLLATTALAAQQQTSQSPASLLHAFCPQFS